MKKIVTALLIIVLTLALVACDNKEGVVTQEKLDALEEGMTKADVKELLGEPLKVEGERWIYDLSKENGTLALQIFFLDDELGGTYTGPK